MRKIHTGMQGRLSGDTIDFQFVIVVKQEDGTTSMITDIAKPLSAKYTADELAMINAINVGLTTIYQPELSDEEIEYHIMHNMRGTNTTPEDLQKLAGFTVEKVIHSYP
jgi:hypothetical protein